MPAAVTEYSDALEILFDPPPSIEGGPGGRSGRMSILLPWGQIDDFLAFAAGGVETVTSGSVSMERIAAVTWPGIPELQLIGYKADGFGTPGAAGIAFQAGMFSHWKVDLEFQELPHAADGETAYYTLTHDVGEQFMTVPGLKLTFSNGTKTPGDFALPVPIIGITMTTFLSTAPLTYATMQLVGKINSVAFTGQDGYSIPQYMLRFTGYKDDFAKGSYTRTLTKSYQFQFRYPHWNMSMRGDGVWDTATLGGTGVGQFLTSDLNQLKYL